MAFPLAIEITDYQEKEDGSAVVTLEMSDEVKAVLIEEGFLSCISRYIEAKNDTKESPEEAPTAP